MLFSNVSGATLTKTYYGDWAFMKMGSAFHFRKVQRSNFDFFQMIPSGYIVGKKLTPNFYAVSDGKCMEIWDSIGSYIGSLFL
jgi:hypothetical protein